MILLVNDANIFIVLLKIDLLEPFFQLPYEFHVTDFVVSEVQEDNRDQFTACIETGQLVKKGFNYQELMEIQLLGLSHKGLSIQDCSCLFHAQKISGRLLTGDAALRRCAQQIQVPVHGLLWVFDQLVDQNIITKGRAYDKLSLLLEINPRLPRGESQKRLTKWK
jgi:predicted nucleic acid-binding protein